MINAVFDGDSLDVCIEGATPACTGPLGGYETAVLQTIPVGPREVTVTPGTGEPETRLVTFDDAESFRGVVAAGLDGTTRVRAEALPLAAISRGARILINSLAGRSSISLPDEAEVPSWSSVEVSLPDSSRRQVVELSQNSAAVTSAEGRAPWAFVFVGEEGLHPREPGAVSAFAVEDDDPEFLLQDGLLQFAAPIVPSLNSSNVVCVDGEPVASNVAGLALTPPVPVGPDAATVSLRAGDNCSADIVVADSLSVPRATRSLVSFGYATSLTAYEDEFSPPSSSAEYRVVNMSVDGSSFWLELRDGSNDETLEVLVAGLPPNEESSAFSLDEDDATTPSGEYFFASGDSPAADLGEWGFDHDAGNRAWIVSSGGDYFVVDTRDYPWAAEEI